MTTSIEITAFTDEQLQEKKEYLTTLSNLDTTTLKILNDKVKNKGAEYYNKKIKSNKNLI